jgi:hypothetical protein
LVNADRGALIEVPAGFRKVRPAAPPSRGIMASVAGHDVVRRHGTAAILFTMCIGVFIAQLDSRDA